MASGREFSRSPSTRLVKGDDCGGGGGGGCRGALTPLPQLLVARHFCVAEQRDAVVADVRMVESNSSGHMNASLTGWNFILSRLSSLRVTFSS